MSRSIRLLAVPAPKGTAGAAIAPIAAFGLVLNGFGVFGTDQYGVERTLASSTLLISFFLSR